MTVKARRISKNRFLIIAQEGNKKMAFEFMLTFGMRISSRKLTDAINELQYEFEAVGIEIYTTEIYDKILECAGKKLPPLLI